MHNFRRLLNKGTKQIKFGDIGLSSGLCFSKKNNRKWTAQLQNTNMRATTYSVLWAERRH